MERNNYNFMRDLNTAGRDVTASFLANLVQYNLMGLAQERGSNLPKIPRRGLDGPSMGLSGQRGWNSSDMNNRFNNTSIGQQGRLELSRSFGGRDERYSQNSRNFSSNSDRNVSNNGTGTADRERRFRLSGACRRWHQRYLKQGYSPKEAMKKALQHSEKYRDMNLREKGKSRPQFISDARKRESQRKGVVESMRSPGGPREARKREDGRKDAKANSKEVSNDNTAKFERVCIAPKDPETYLDDNDLLVLENAIVSEVALGWKHKLQFNGIHVRPGMLLINCAVPHTTEWIKEVTTNLKKWKGVPLKIYDKDEIPTAEVVSCSLPNSAGQSIDVTLKLIESQNEGLQTNSWVIISHRDKADAMYLLFAVDDATHKTFQKLDWKLSYRFGNIILNRRNNVYEGFVRDVRSLYTEEEKDKNTIENQETEENQEAEETEENEEAEETEDTQEEENPDAEDEQQENDDEAHEDEPSIEGQMECEEEVAEETEQNEEEDMQSETLED